MKIVLHQILLCGLLLIISWSALQAQVSTRPTSVNPTTVCPNGQITLAADVTDDGRLGIRESADGGGKYWVSYYRASTNQLVSDFKTYNEVYVGTPVTRPAGQYTATNRISGPITIPSDLPPGTYYCRIFVGEPTARLNPNNANNSPTFTVNAPATVVISDATPTYNPAPGGGPAVVKLTFGGTGPWSYRYDDLSTGLVNSNNHVPSEGYVYIRPTSDYVFDASKLLFFSGACGTSTAISGSSTIRVTKLSVTTVTLSNNNICPGRDAFTAQFSVGGSAPGGVTYTAQISNQNGEFQNPITIGSGSTSPITCNPELMKSLSPGTYKVRVISNSSAVEWTGSSVPITLTRSPLPVVNELSYCGNATQPLQAGGENLFWYGISTNGGASYTGHDKPTPPPSPTEPGSYMYQISQRVNGCESALAYLKVTVKPKSSPPGDATKDYCKGEAAQPLTTNGQSLIWYNSSGAQLGQAPTPDTNTPGNNQTYKVSQDNNGCRSDQSTITVRIKDLPDAPVVSNPAPICQFGPAQPLSASGQGLKWYDASGNALGGAPTPSLGATATQVYQVSQTRDNCEGPKARIEQTIKAAPGKPVVEAKTYCVGQTAVPLTAAGQTLTWYKDGTKLSGSPTPPTGQAQTLVYEVSQTADNCESERTSLTVRVLAAPGVPTVRPLGLCQGVPAASLSTAVTGDAIKWYADATVATSQPEPTPPTAQTGVQSYYVSQTVGNCEGPRAQLNVTVHPIPPVPSASDPGPLCQYQTQTVSSFTALGDNKLWYSAGQSSGSGQPPITDTTVPGAFTVAVTQTINACTSSPKVITQVVNKAPELPTAAPLQLCFRDPAKPISATALTGHTLTWYGTNATGGTPSATTPVIAADPTRTETYYFTQTDGITKCESKRQGVLITVANKPGPPAVAATQFACQNTTPIALTAVGSDLLWSGSGLTSSTTTAPTPPTSASTGTPFSYTVVQRLGSCISDPSTIAYSIKPLPIAPTLKSPQTACIGEPSFALSGTGQNLRWYEEEMSRANPRTQVTVQTTAPFTKTWFVTQTDANGCESPVTPQVIRVLAKATARLTGDGEILTYDSTAIRIHFGGEGPWTATLWDDRVITTDENPKVIWVRPLTTRTYALKALSNACGPGDPSNTYEVRVSPVTSIDPLRASVSLSMYPNPVGGTIRVDWSAPSRKSVVLRVLSVTGSVVWQVERVGTGTAQTESISASTWTAGNYFLQLRSESAGLLENKIIKL